MYSFENIGEAIKIATERRVQELKDRVLIAATTALLSEYKVRIFDKGLDSNDSKIGAYSTKPLYASKLNVPRKGSIKPIGKYGDTKFANGKPHKSQYMPQGYKELRTNQGRQSDTVNLNLSGSEENNITVAQIGIGETGIVMSSVVESGKRKAQEKKYGKKIFAASPNDISYLNKAIEAEIEAIASEL